MSMSMRSVLGRTGVVAVVLAVSSGIAIGTAPSSFAHSELISASPAADALLKKSPKSVILTFGEGVVAQGSAIVVTGPDGERYDKASTLQVDGEQASVNLRPSSMSGSFEVAYRVVSADGHVVQDDYAYELKLPASASPTVSPTASPTAGPTVEPSTSPVGSTDTDSDSSVVWVLGAGAIGLALLAALAAVIVRRRRG